MTNTLPDTAPTAPTTRYIGLDILRGVAVLAIFVVNIKAMGALFPYYTNASLWPGPHDMTIAMAQAFAIDDKWRTIFTALFGAGLVLFTENAVAKGRDAHRLMTRRLLFLLLFGLVHLLMIWVGDILTIYALAGFVAMRFVSFETTRLWRWAAILFALSVVWILTFDFLTALDPFVRTQLKQTVWEIPADQVSDAMAPYLGTPLDQFEDRMGKAVGYIVFYYIMGGRLLDTVAVMLAGMALWQSGFLKGQWRPSHYLRSALASLGVASALSALRWGAFVRSDWAYEAFVTWDALNLLIGPAGGFGFAALVMLFSRKARRAGPFARAGRMAFTNYIACSLIGTSLFYGHGLGLFGQLTLAEMMLIVGATFILLLIFSSLWLALFRFGPLEWLWRSLTYGKIQPTR